MKNYLTKTLCFIWGIGAISVGLYSIPAQLAPQQTIQTHTINTPADAHTESIGHEHKENDDHDNVNKLETKPKTEHGLSLSAAAIALANIKVSTIKPSIFTQHIYAPGEIKANGYTSYIVSPRIESVVVSRHAILGEHVIQGQPLVTLFSETMAEAQANYRIAYSEWQRSKKLGSDTVSESQLLKNETTYVAALGRLRAFGLTEKAITEITKSTKNNHLNLGEYTLVAQRSGAVLSDDFSQGQRVIPGEKIMVLANEDNLWVEASVSPNKPLNLPVGTTAEIEFSGQLYPAHVIQEAHTIDPRTRTRIVRLSVDNTNDRLHSGMFVNVTFGITSTTAIMAVPETALMRSADGDWTVFVEDHPGEFEAVEVKLGQPMGNYRQIIGLEPNTKVVTQGAFFIASEIAKGGFDPHNH